MAGSKKKSSAKTPVKAGESEDALKKRAVRISNTLRKVYHGQGTALHFADPFQLLVATVLSAQCTDEQVNRTTPGLFAAFPTPQKMARADPAAIEKLIYQTGFYRQKTRSIIALSKSLMEKFGGRVPESMEELTSLAGVGRKTANLVRAMAFGHPGLIVDTHFKRVSGRLGLVETDDPTKVEFRVAELLPPSHWTEFSNALIWHGRRYCNARQPNCGPCPVLRDCPHGQTEKKAGAS